jgi:hypothetical protein
MDDQKPMPGYIAQQVQRLSHLKKGIRDSHLVSVRIQNLSPRHHFPTVCPEFKRKLHLRRLKRRLNVDKTWNSAMIDD